MSHIDVIGLPYDIRPGDTVTLPIGGPVMVVEYLFREGGFWPFSSGRPVAHCFWLDKAGRIEVEDFHPACLRRVQVSATPPENSDVATVTDGSPS